MRPRPATKVGYRARWRNHSREPIGGPFDELMLLRLPVNLRQRDVMLPPEGWGEIHLHRATPHTGSTWTDSGKVHDDRQLKHRAEGESRVVPCSPELAALLRGHLRRFATDEEGRVFTGVRGGPVATITYERVWRQARQAVFTSEVCASPLARRPYDLRHACVSTWLNRGVPATEVAEWAGHSVAVLLEVYAKCLDGGRQGAISRLDDALGKPSNGWEIHGSRSRIGREEPPRADEGRDRSDRAE